MPYATLQKQKRQGYKRTTQDNDDTIGEGITIGLILVLGIISIINSIGVAVYSVVLVINKQLVLMELLRTLIVAGFILALGLSSLHIFRKRLSTLTRKKSPWGP